MSTSTKRMTTALVLLFGLLMLLTSAAQPQPQRISVEEHMKVLKDKLKLNNEQSKKIRTILEDQREEIGIAINDNRGDRQAMQTELKEITKKTDNKIKKILTENQCKAYDKIIKDRQAQMDKQMKSSIE